MSFPISAKRIGADRPERRVGRTSGLPSEGCCRFPGALPVPGSYLHPRPGFAAGQASTPSDVRTYAVDLSGASQSFQSW